MGLWSNNVWIESVQGIKKLVFEHFKKQYEAVEERLAYFSDSLFQAKVEFTDNEVLRLFELTSGLKVNYWKSRLYGFNVLEPEIMEAAKVLGCEIGRGAVSYLGMLEWVCERGVGLVARY
ncbi:hypothetical protein ACS0TY_013900 [Phlomoides rotata]